MPVDHWEGIDVIITMEEEGLDTVVNYEGKITNFNVSGGKKPTEDKYCFGDNTISFDKPREQFTPSFDVIFTDAAFGHMQLGGSAHAAGNEMRSSDTKKRWRITIWALPKASRKKSGTVVVPPKTGEIYRMIFTDAKSASFERTGASDDGLMGSIGFEFSAVDSSGYANFFEEWTSAQSTTALTVLSGTAHKGILTWNTTTPAWTGSYRT